MIKNQQTKQEEQLSRALDALNSGGTYAADADTEGLVAVARLVKQSRAADEASARLITETVDQLASELGARHKKRRAVWGLSGAVGAVAAACVLFALNVNFFMPQDINRNYTHNTTDLTKIVQIQQEQTVLPGTEAKHRAAAPQPFAADESKPASPAGDTAVKKIDPVSPAAEPKAKEAPPATEPKTVAMAEKPVRQSSPQAMLALEGRQARSQTVDHTTGEIRQTYTTETGEVTLVQGGKKKDGMEVAAAAPQNSVMMKAAEQGDTPSAKQTEQQLKKQQLNRVTVTVDGIEATVEGEQPEEDLKKLAEKVVKE